jgi:hypothetical protein
VGEHEDFVQDRDAFGWSLGCDDRERQTPING